jgi:parvulin-like peptidyl-prolyl isomerase
MSAFKRWTVLTTMAVAGLGAWVAGAQVAPRGSAAPPSAPATAPPPAVATVGGRRITQSEFEQRAAQGLAEYRARNATDLPAEIVPIARRQMLESLIRRDLLVLEARRRGLQGDLREAEAQLRRDPFFQVNGRFDESRFELARRQSPEAFEAALRSIREQLAARDLMDRLQDEKGPAEAAVQARAARAMSRATLDYLALRYADFDGDIAEPRESEIRAHYDARRADFQRPRRASLSVVFVDQPALPESAAAVPATLARWTERMKATADSILAAVRGGRSLEEACVSQGVPRPNQVVVPGNFPRYWQGSAAQEAAVFAAAPGATLPAPVPAQRGWLLVRVDEVREAHTAPLAEVATEVRTRLRAERRRMAADAGLQEIYAAWRDSLRLTAYRVRYAAVDTTAVRAGEPRPADLERYYRAHLADYSAFDTRGLGVTSRPLAEVRDEVRARWLNERRFALAREAAERLWSVWSRGRRDAGLERRLGMRDVGPAVPGLPADTGRVGAMLGDSLSARALGRGPALARGPAGWFVYHVYESVPDHVPTFAQARERLVEHRTRLRHEEEEAGAKRLFEQSPRRFTGGELIHYTRAFVPIDDILNVRLTRSEVERYHRERIDRFSAPELVRASHILVSPTDETPEADARARARADSLLARLRAGEDFERTAALVTDDPATRDNGGDLGVFARGAMLPEVERAAFAMRPGDLSAAPVKSPVGYHLLKAREYVPMVAQPLSQIYGDVAAYAAEEKADSLAMRRADSLLRMLPDAKAGRAAATKLGLVTLSYEHERGEREKYPTDLHAYYQRLETLRPGQVLPLRRKIGGMGYAVTWVDSIGPARAPRWETSRERALEAYRAEAGQRAALAKRAELDSLELAGWAFDSLAADFGGMQRVSEFAPGSRLPGLGASGPLDTLVFGQEGDDGLAAGSLSGWVALPGGLVRVRPAAVRLPDATALASRVQAERREETDAALNAYFEELKKRFPVRILDRQLRQTLLPQMQGAR